MSDSERLSILEDYLGSDLSKKAIARKYHISPTSILKWLRIFGLEDKLYYPQGQAQIMQKGNVNSSLSEELEELKKENARLKAQLKREELGHKIYKRMVDLAERTYNIPISKNSETK